MRTPILLIAGIIAATALPALAIPNLVMICGAETSTSTNWSPPGQQTGSNQYQFNGGRSDPQGLWQMTWNINVDTDPFINGVFGLTNISGSTQTFILNVLLPSDVVISPSSLMGGSTGGSVTDANNSGAATLSTSPGIPFYAGQIDGSTALSLHNDPFSVSAPFAGGTANIPSVNAGLPGPTLPGPALLSTIGIRHQFTLTPGDTVAITSFFIVVPEPASLALLAIGSLALIRRR